jgi:hypothetical protein
MTRSKFGKVSSGSRIYTLNEAQGGREHGTVSLIGSRAFVIYHCWIDLLGKTGWDHFLVMLVFGTWLGRGAIAVVLVWIIA